ncbi:MAG: hypothetical protein ABIV50_06030 [Opitutus sp.]
MSWLTKFVSSGRGGKSSKGTADPAVRLIRLSENPQHPVIALFESRRQAKLQADALGAPWVSMAYACGYVLTDGWNFRDADGLVPTFCPVPPDALDTMQALVIALQTDRVPGNELMSRVTSVLQDIPCLAGLPRLQFQDACNCTVMRVCYPSPVGAKDDWLTMPAWALRLPSRRLRLA